MQDLTTLARSCGRHGEVVLRRRGTGDDAVDELIVNGAFAMDSVETGSERALAAFAAPGSRVLVGGLGLGFTVAELLDGHVASIDLVELEGALVTWAYEAKTPRLGRVAADPRVRLWVDDIRTVLAATGVEPQPPWDAILLDVDNGPDFLIHAENADLYRLPTLEQAYAQLCPGGVLAIWCQGPHAGLWSAVRALTSASREDRRRAVRGRHRIDYVIYSARAPDRGRQQ